MRSALANSAKHIGETPMRILHYFLGSHRQGGLNRYASDLATEQAKSGHQVFVLFPDGGLFSHKKSTISRYGKKHGVSYWKLTDGVPVPLLEGLRDPEWILNPEHKLSDKAINKFYAATHPDVFHIHTWMGFPVELLPFFKNNGVKVVYTTHDYFGICPKVNLINEQDCLCTCSDNRACSCCNMQSPSAKFLKIRNFSLLMKLKPFLKPFLNLKKRNKATMLPSESAIAEKTYDKLRSYYHDLWKQCDKIHFNSSITKRIFHQYFPNLEGKIIPITHGSIQDHRQPRKLKKDCIRLCFIGSGTPYKGLPLLLETLEKIHHRNWLLDIWGAYSESNSKSICYHGEFSPDQLHQVFKEADLLIVPSICWETFGFVVAEANSFGIPVLCSDMVGAQTLLPTDMIYHNSEGLYERLTFLLEHPDRLEEISRIICKKNKILTMSAHVMQIETLYLS